MSDIANSRTVNPDAGRERAASENLTPIADYWELYCRECGYRDRGAYVVSICPFCGGDRAGPRLPPVEELVYELLQDGLDVGDIAQAAGVSGPTVYRWKSGEYDVFAHKTHKRLAKVNRDRQLSEVENDE